MFTAALFTIAKSWKQPLTDGGMKMWYLDTMEYHSPIKRMKLHDICCNMDGHAYSVNSDRERQISYDITYLWNLRHDANEFIYKIERLRQREKKPMVTKGEERRNKLAVWD